MLIQTAIVIFPLHVGLVHGLLPARRSPAVYIGYDCLSPESGRMDDAAQEASR